MQFRSRKWLPASWKSGKCEVYQCTHCRQRFKTVIDIKKHFVEVNYLEYGYLAQLKLDRNECNKVTEKGYHSIKISFLQFL